MVFLHPFRCFSAAGCAILPVLVPGPGYWARFSFPHRTYFSCSAKNQKFLAGKPVVQFFKERFQGRHYPGFHGTSFTKPAKRNLPFLHTGQLGCRKFWIHSRISAHTVS
jgi:hypothetical protein